MSALAIEQFTELYKRLPDQAQERLYQLALEEAKKAGVAANGIHHPVDALSEADQEAAWRHVLQDLDKRLAMYDEWDNANPLPADAASQIDHYL